MTEDRSLAGMPDTGSMAGKANSETEPQEPAGKANSDTEPQESAGKVNSETEPADDGLLARMNRLYPGMSKGSRRLADYIEKNYDTAAFLTAAELGRRAGVSEATAVRFASTLGYHGYGAFRQAVEKLVRSELALARQAHLDFSSIPGDRVLDTVLQNDCDNIRLTLEQTDRRAFALAADTILQARTVYVIGIRSCAPLAEFLAFYLRQILPDVRMLTSTSLSEIFEQMIRIGEEDAVIGISFPRYSVRTLKALEFANNRSAQVITLTDSVHSPVNLYSSCNLLAHSGMASIADSLAAPLSLINALIVTLFLRRQDEVIGTLKEVEQAWQDYAVYGGDEINRLDDEIKL